MSIGNVVVSQDAPAKNNLWIQPKGTARFWNGSIWKAITGNGGGGGDDYYTKTESDTRFFLNSNINGVSGYATKFTGPRALTYANDYIRIGDGIIYWDTVSSGFRIYHSDLLTNPSSTSKAGVYADWVSAFGANSSGGGGGGGMDETALWQELTGDPQWTLGDDKIININHLPNNINADTVDGYHANSFAFANGTNATGTWGISISGNATSATTATYDSDGNTISSTYLPLAGGTMTGTINSQSILPKTTNTYDIGNESYNYSYGCFNVLYPGTNNNLWLCSNAASGSTTGIVFGYGGKTASTILGKWTYTGLGIGTDSPDYKLHVNGSTGHAGGHIYLTGANASSSTGNTTQLVFGTSSSNHVAVSSNSNALIINPSTASTTGQIVLGVNGGSSYFTSSGNFGIGTNSPAYKLTVEGNIVASNTIGVSQTAGSGVGISLYGSPPSSGLPNYGLAFASTSNFGKFGDVQGDWATYFTMDTTWGTRRGWVFRTNNTSLNVASISSEGNFCAYGGVTALATSSSDKRLKKNIKPFEAKSIIDKLKPIEFEWNKKANKYNSNLELNKKNYGLIAQDSDNIIDNLVFDLPDGKGYKGVRYEKLIPILLQAVKEQQSEINELKQIIKDLKYEIFNKGNS